LKLSATPLLLLSLLFHYVDHGDEVQRCELYVRGPPSDSD